MNRNEVLDTLTELEKLLRVRKTIADSNIAVPELDQIIEEKVDRIEKTASEDSFAGNGSMFLAKLVEIRFAMTDLDFSTDKVLSVIEKIYSQMNRYEDLSRTVNRYMNEDENVASERLLMQDQTNDVTTNDHRSIVPEESRTQDKSNKHHDHHPSQDEEMVPMVQHHTNDNEDLIPKIPEVQD
ncbi:MAG: hypothetical protein Q9225_003015 [Loekoesia sp. 1 TL-2023]